MVVSRIGAGVFFGALLIFVVVYSFQGGATTAMLYPGACSGTWLQPAHAQGKPDVDFNASPDAFTTDNSALVVRNDTDQKQIFCSNFFGDDLLASSSPQLVTLRLSWAIGAKDHTASSSPDNGLVQQTVQFTPSQQVLDQIASSSASGTTPTASSTTDAAAASSSASAPATNAPTSATPADTSSPAPAPAAPDNSSTNAQPATVIPTDTSAAPAPADQTPPPAPVLTPSAGPTSLLQKLFPPFFLRAFADQVSTTQSTIDTTASAPAPAAADATASTTATTDQTTTPPAPASIVPQTASTSPTNNSASLLQEASSSDAETSTTQNVLQDSPSIPVVAMPADTSSSTTTPDGVPIMPPGPITPSAPAVPMFEIRYSLDGATWETLGQVTKDQMNQPFVVPITSNDDIKKLQIAVVTLDLSGLSLDQAAYLDGMALTVTYPTVRPEKKNGVDNGLMSDRVQLLSSSGAFLPSETQDDDFSNKDMGVVSCVADPFSQTIVANGIAQYALTLSGPSDASFDFSGAYASTTNALSQAIAAAGSALSSSTPTDTTTSASATSSLVAVSDAATDTASTTDTSSVLSVIATDTIGTPDAAATGSAVSSSDAVATASSGTMLDAALSRLMPFLITLGNYPQGIVPSFSQDASGTPQLSFSADKTALPGSYTLIVRVMAKYHGQLKKGFCQLNLIVK